MIAACNACGKEVSETANVCPHCGHKMHGSISRLGGVLAVVLIVLFMAMDKCA